MMKLRTSRLVSISLLLLLCWSDRKDTQMGVLAFVTTPKASVRGVVTHRDPRITVPIISRRVETETPHCPLWVLLSPQDTDEKQQELQQIEPNDHSEFVERVELVERFEMAEFVGIGIWLAALSSFILLNEFIGPWPENLMKAIPGNIWLVCHYVGGMLFAGGIVMTTCIEWLVASTKDSSVLKFWFGQVPVLDAAIVLPGLTMTMVAGTGVSIHHYGGLGKTPAHIETVFWTLVVFAVWWALTDLTTQPKAAEAIEKWAEERARDPSSEKDIPGIVHFRKISNVVSCMFILALYGIMTLKPGLGS